MSRVGNKLIVLKDGVTVDVKAGNVVTVKGPKGELTNTFNKDMMITVENNTVKVARPSDSIQHKTLHGTTRACLNNMVVGVTEGYKKTLIIEGVGYRASLEGKKLVLAVGYSHLVTLDIPEGLTVSCPQPTEVSVSGIDKQLVGEFAANIRATRKPEPYHGKGIHYSDEVVRRKEVKKAK